MNFIAPLVASFWRYWTESSQNTAPLRNVIFFTNTEPTNLYNVPAMSTSIRSFIPSANRNSVLQWLSLFPSYGRVDPRHSLCCLSTGQFRPQLNKRSCCWIVLFFFDSDAHLFNLYWMPTVGWVLCKLFCLILSLFV